MPPRLRRMLHLLRYLPRDTHDRLTGRRPQLVPPRGLQYHGAGDFEETGRHLLRLLVEEGGLSPADRVLDIGCGIGRVASPLTRYLGPEGSYEGFDLSPSDVRWCQRQITPRFPRFRFHLADVCNTEYNRHGGVDAAEYVFPFADESFDFVFATSVFTHLLAAATENYLGQARRVLRPDGTLLATFFILNSESRRLAEERRVELRFETRLRDAWIHDPRNPESAVAFEEDWLRRCYGEVGLLIAEPIRYGSWTGRSPAASFQDVVIARPEESAS